MQCTIETASTSSRTQRRKLQRKARSEVVRDTFVRNQEEELDSLLYDVQKETQVYSPNLVQKRKWDLRREILNNNASLRDFCTEYWDSLKSKQKASSRKLLRLSNWDLVKLARSDSQVQLLLDLALKLEPLEHGLGTRLFKVYQYLGVKPNDYGKGALETARLLWLFEQFITRKLVITGRRPATLKVIRQRLKDTTAAATAT